EEYRKAYQGLYEGTSDKAAVIRDKGYIETDKHVTVMLPLKGEDGEAKAILCVQVQMNNLEAARLSYVRNVIIVMILLAAVVITAEGFYLHYAILLPMKKITEEASRFARENVVEKDKLTDTIHNKDEIGLLAKSIDYMETKIHSYVENLTQITAERERINTELSVASRIQTDSLPNVFPAFPDRTEFDIYASMDPAKEVGGDFYDFFLVDDDHLCLFIADVSGKGVPAALLMMSAKSIISNNANKSMSPAEILAVSNKEICSRNKEDMFITVWLGILEISTGRLVAANAGHEYPVLRDGDGSFALVNDKHCVVIGGFEDVKFTDYELQLRSGSKLFLYTDGVPEATDADSNMFGEERLVAALNEDPGASPEVLLNTVRKAVDGFVKEAEQFDDLTMMCLEYK
ncbi:MAG: SpoIIE family protein phosphatase, partial [Spirochaetales bacterium]|nr:SpoIIE family protein phosphatase [Spirochaetales bacterium]